MSSKKFICFIRVGCWKYNDNVIPILWILNSNFLYILRKIFCREIRRRPLGSTYHLQVQFKQHPSFFGFNSHASTVLLFSELFSFSISFKKIETFGQLKYLEKSIRHFVLWYMNIYVTHTRKWKKSIDFKCRWDTTATSNTVQQ